MRETISEAISTDHESFDVYYENIKNAEDDAGKVRWRNQLTWTLARHAISEELTLYPAMEKHLGPTGVELTKTDKEQHQGVSLVSSLMANKYNLLMLTIPLSRSRTISTKSKT